MDGFEVGWQEEMALHDALLVPQREQQRQSFRPGVNRLKQPVDVLLQERTAKKLARAYRVLQQEYLCDDQLIEQALSYTNSLEDALRFLAFQFPSDQLPSKLCALGPSSTETEVSESTLTQLDVVRQSQSQSQSQPTTRVVQEEDEVDRIDDGEQQEDPVAMSRQVDDWEDEADTQHVEPVAAAQEATRDAAIAKAWTQRFLEEELDEEEHEEEVDERARLETKYADVFDQLQTAKHEKQKRLVKALTLEIDHQRQQLRQLGWDEQDFLREFYQRQATKKKSQATHQEKPREEEEPTKNESKEEDEEETETGFGFMFDDAESSVVSAAAIEQRAEVTEQNDVKRSNLSPSLSNWSGKTPRVHLEEFCRKQKLPRPQFKKLHGDKRGSWFEFSVVMADASASTQKSNKKTEYQLPKEIDRKQFTTMEEARSAIATYVLYQLSPNLPLYRVLPPFYREMWCEWLAEAQAHEDSLANKQKQSFDNKIDAILQLVPDEIRNKEAIMPVSSLGPVALVALEAKQDAEDDQVDDWEVGYDSFENGEQDMCGVAPASQETETPQFVCHESHCQPDLQGFEKRRRELCRLLKKNSKQYADYLLVRQKLPIFDFRDQLMDALVEHDVILVSGETGCGKSTQVPQFVLEQLLTQGAGSGSTRYPNVICTQPRRLAAISVAERVSRELGEPRIGTKESLVGYQIRFESKTSVNTALTFCTTGVLLRKLQDPSAWDTISHVILDEVHERDVQIDLLLTILKEKLVAQKKQTGGGGLKVILMSATLNAGIFQQYFGGKSDCPLLSVPGRTFPVQDFFLEDILELTNHRLDSESRCYKSLDEDASTSTVQMKITGRGNKTMHQRVSYSSSESTAEAAKVARVRALCLDESRYSSQTVDTLVHYDLSVINYDLIQDLVVFLIESERVQRGQAILIFLPGSQEIRTCLNLLAASPFTRELRVEMIPLHAGLSSQEQSKVFKPCSSGIKIIAATNIAETSLTIEDVVVVIDSGKVKQLQQNPTKQINLLEETWCSKANAKQRAGRAGRVQEGCCYRLYTNHFLTSKMPASSLAEIQRVNLTSICLLIKSLANATSLSSRCDEFLATCLEPPAPSRVQHAIDELLALGALTISDDGEQTLTSLGKKLAQLPLDVKLGKMLLLGALFDCFDSISTTVALLESKSLFVAPMGQQKQLQMARKYFSMGFSDMLTDVNAFDQWRRVKAQREKATLHRFCERFYLNQRVLKEVHQMKIQFAQLVQQLGFTLSSKIPNDKDDQSDGGKTMTKTKLWLVASVIYASLAPNVARVDPETLSKPRRKLRDAREEMTFHLSSINGESSLVFPKLPLFMTFPYKLHTSSVQLPVCGLVPLSGLVLFSGSMRWVIEKQMVLLNDWIWLHMSPRSAMLMEHLRHRVHSHMQSLLDDPAAMIAREWIEMRKFVEELCQSEQQRLEIASHRSNP